MEKNFNEIFDNISFDSFNFEDKEESSKSHSKKHDCDDVSSKSHSKSSRRSSKSHSKSRRRNGRISVTSTLGCREREVLSGVTVALFKVVGCSLDFVSSKVTNSNGRVVFRNLEDGIYKVVQPIRGSVFEEPIFLPTDQVKIDENHREFDIIIINKLIGSRSRSRSRSRSISRSISRSRSRSRSRSISISRSKSRSISRIRCRRRRRVNDFVGDEIFILIILFFFFGCGWGFPFGFGGFFF